MSKFFELIGQAFVVLIALALLVLVGMPLLLIVIRYGLFPYLHWVMSWLP